MAAQIPVVALNTKALDNNISQIGENKFAIPAKTPNNYKGFGQVQNMNNPEDTAYFFSKYADDSTNMNGPACNVIISTENPDDKGRVLINDIKARSGQDGYLSHKEMQEWADEIGYTGDVVSIMQTMGEMDDWLSGSNTMNFEYSPVDLDEDLGLLDKTTPEEETQPEENPLTESWDEARNDENTSALDVFSTFTKWVTDGISAIGDWLLG